jgi:hypothetical protein
VDFVVNLMLPGHRASYATDRQIPVFPGSFMFGIGIAIAIGNRIVALRAISKSIPDRDPDPDSDIFWLLCRAAILHMLADGSAFLKRY